MLDWGIDLRSGMKLSQEDIVTKILSDDEILKVNYVEDELNKCMYSTNPLYDLNHFLKTASKEPSRWGEKYVFVR